MLGRGSSWQRPGIQAKIRSDADALETAHAFAYLDTLMKEFDKNSNIIVNVSGRGDKDINTVANIDGIKI